MNFKKRDVKKLHGEVVVVGRINFDNENILISELKKVVRKVSLIGALQIKKNKLPTRDIAVLRSMERYDWILFTSKLAASFFIDEINARKIKIPPHTRIGAVGSETARVLTHAGLKVSVVPSTFSAENLAKRIIPYINGKNILFPRSVIASYSIVDQLRKGGAHVRLLALYDVASVHIPRVQIIPLEDRRVDYIIFTSSSGVKSFLKSVSKEKNARKNVLNTPTICIGSVTARAAHSAHFKIIHTAETSTSEGIVNLLRGLR